MYLFIFESIGTSELILVGVIALIIFGPRKLPEMMRTLGKAMSEFKRSTNEFKQSWEKEVSQIEEIANLEPGNNTLPASNPDNAIGRNAPKLENEISAPAIKEIDNADLESIFPGAVSAAPTVAPKVEDETDAEAEAETVGKRDWF